MPSAWYRPHEVLALGEGDRAAVANEWGPASSSSLSSPCFPFPGRTPPHCTTPPAGWTAAAKGGGGCRKLSSSPGEAPPAPLQPPLEARGQEADNGSKIKHEAVSQFRGHSTHTHTDMHIHTHLCVLIYTLTFLHTHAPRLPHAHTHSYTDTLIH